MFKDTLFFEGSKGEQDYDAFVDTAKVCFHGRLEVHAPIEFLNGTPQEYAHLIEIMKQFDTGYTLNDLEAFLEEKTVTGVCHDEKIILCYDGMRKFNAERLKSLEKYPSSISFSYPLSHWMTVCREVNYRNPRAVTDALVDSYVDIVGERMGYHVIRIQQGEFDWTAPGGVQLLEKLIRNAKTKQFQDL